MHMNPREFALSYRGSKDRSAMQIFWARLYVSLIVGIILSIVLIVTSPKATRIEKKAPDGSIVSKPCIPSALLAGTLASATALGLPYLIQVTISKKDKDKDKDK